MGDTTLDFTKKILAFNCRPFNEVLEIEVGLFSTASSH
jgi:hypothetical protein